VNSVLEFARDAWFGRAPLWKVFWLAGELAGTTLAVILFVVIPIGPYTAAALALSVPYLVWIYVSMWRCALELTRFRGHLNVGDGGVHDGRQDDPIHAGV